MTMTTQTRAFLQFLGKNPGIRARIRARPDKTILFAGKFFKDMWRELEALKKSDPQIADKDMISDILGSIALSGQSFPNLLAWANSFGSVIPWEANGFIVWRALSGIYASNATGLVSFYVGSKVAKETKVFAATEVHVIKRNPNVDQSAKDIADYYLRCIHNKNEAMNFGYIA